MEVPNFGKNLKEMKKDTKSCNKMQRTLSFARYQPEVLHGAKKKP
jgi:hypothetical protein